MPHWQKKSDHVVYLCLVHLSGRWRSCERFDEASDLLLARLPFQLICLRHSYTQLKFRYVVHFAMAIFFQQQVAGSHWCCMGPYWWRTDVDFLDIFARTKGQDFRTWHLEKSLFLKTEAHMYRLFSACECFSTVHVKVVCRVSRSFRKFRFQSRAFDQDS